MSQTETPPESSAAIAALETLIDSRINQQQPTTEELAQAVAPLIEIPEPERLTEAQVEQVIALIDEHAPADDGARDGSDDGYGDGPYGDGDGADDGYGDGDGDGDGDSPNESYHGRVDRELLRMRISSDPTHKATIETGTPSGDYHPYGDWGNILTVHEPVHWESAVIDAQSGGTTRLRIREIDFEAPTIENGSYIEGGKYELGSVVATRDLQHGSGPQEIYPEVTLMPGQYFIDRDPDQVHPMRRVSSGADFDAINADHRVPVEINQSWRGVPSYTPGGDSYESPYLARDWNSNIYYFGNLEFGFMEPEEDSTNDTEVENGG